MTSKFKNFLKFLVKNYYRTKGHFNIKIFKKIKESENMRSSIYYTSSSKHHTNLEACNAVVVQIYTIMNCQCLASLFIYFKLSIPLQHFKQLQQKGRKTKSFLEKEFLNYILTAVICIVKIQENVQI